MRLSTSIFGLFVTTAGILTIVFSQGYKFDARISLVVILLAFAFLIGIGAFIKSNRDKKALESSTESSDSHETPAMDEATTDSTVHATTDATTDMTQDEVTSKL
ncbi:hypothetical protein [Arcanobacterium bovis]|uniref:Uncharacterized protein n=1 Tax=Arcanobacterium bovis TaxID=2529275 RepID=A0A4Q9V288_9ACTO|nr:hypothetical protein [Arcanobacterium bovis]TBW22155.1 hypothetical protein EZJ44_04855 [Arcanobacterium bovis]